MLLPFFVFREVPMPLYHRTSADRVASILREGLKRDRSTTWRGAGGCIYLSTMPNTNFGEVLFEVDAKGLELADLSDWEYVSWRDIPPERLRLVAE